MNSTIEMCVHNNLHTAFCHRHGTSVNSAFRDGGGDGGGAGGARALIAVATAEFAQLPKNNTGDYCP